MLLLTSFWKKWLSYRSWGNFNFNDRLLCMPAIFLFDWLFSNPFVDKDAAVYTFWTFWMQNTEVERRVECLISVRLTQKNYFFILTFLSACTYQLPFKKFLFYLRQLYERRIQTPITCQLVGWLRPSGFPCSRFWPKRVMGRVVVQANRSHVQ